MESHGAEREDHSSPTDIENPSIPLVNSIRGMIDGLPPLSPDCCIYRVPEYLRQLNKKAYTPQKVSIGPLHHGKKNLLAMEEQKLRYLPAFLERTQLSLEKCIMVIKEWEDRARNCYAETIKLSSDEFVKMILVDSSFIIEIIVRYNISGRETEKDYLSKFCMIVPDVRVDLMLLENQLPFFVLEGLFNLSNAFTFRPVANRSTFIVLCIEYFGCFLLNNNDIRQKIPNSKVVNFVDLLRSCHLPSPLKPLPEDSVTLVAIRTAKDLQEVGLNFKRGSSNRPLDMHYAGEVLEIPQLFIRDWSESVLRNLIALEQCHYPFDSYIIFYIAFMDSLIDTAEDVDLLIQSGIIDCILGDSAAVARLFNNLTMKVEWWGSSYYYHDICRSLDAYCQVPWHKWKATLKRDNFSTPWRTASTITAVIFLVLTLIQAVCSVISL